MRGFPCYVLEEKGTCYRCHCQVKKRSCAGQDFCYLGQRRQMRLRKTGDLIGKTITVGGWVNIEIEGFMTRKEAWRQGLRLMCPGDIKLEVSE